MAAVDDSPCVRATVKPPEPLTVNPLTLAFSGRLMSLPPESCAHIQMRTPPRGRAHERTPPSPTALIHFFFLIVAWQRLEKVSAPPLDIDSAIVIISSFPFFLSSDVNNSLSLSLKPSVHLPYVGWRWTSSLTRYYTHTHTRARTHTHGETDAQRRRSNTHERR